MLRKFNYRRDSKHACKVSSLTHVKSQDTYGVDLSRETGRMLGTENTIPYHLFGTGQARGAWGLVAKFQSVLG